MASKAEEATPSLYSDIDIKEEPVLTDSCHQQPMKEFEQIYIKEENIKLEIPDDHYALDPLQLEEEKRGRPKKIRLCDNAGENDVNSVVHKIPKELRNEVQLTDGTSESESIIPVTMEEHSTSGGSGRLGASDASDMEMGNAIRNTVQEGEICDRSSSSLYFKHSYSDCNLISCSACVKKFKTKSILQKHSRLHMAQRDHKCVMCHKVVPFHCLLGVHSAVDTEEQSYICSVCAKRVEYRRLLGAHLPEHTGETACACLICQKKFRQSSSLRIHLRSHTGKRPHTCGVCGKTFINSSSLNTHSLVHAGEQPYACSFCHKTFKKHTNQRTHRQITHTGEGAIFLYNLPRDIVT